MSNILVAIIFILFTNLLKMNFMEHKIRIESCVLKLDLVLFCLKMEYFVLLLVGVFLEKLEMEFLQSFQHAHNFVLLR